MPALNEPAIPRHRTGVMRFLRRLRRDESGVTAVEFGMIATPFFLFIVALVETAIVHLTSLNLENAVKDASREIRTGQAQVAEFTASDFRAAICGKMYFISSCLTNANLKVDVRSFDDFGVDPAALPDLYDENGDWSDEPAYQPGGGLRVVIVRAYYKMDLLAQIPGIGLANLPSNYLMLDAVSVFRNEPFS